MVIGIDRASWPVFLLSQVVGDLLRELLRAGARRGVLPWGQTRMADFSIVGELVENVIFLDLDEELA